MNSEYMKKIYKKLMLEQMQEKMNNFLVLLKTPTPKNGWIRSIREALGMTGAALAKRLNCSQANLTTLERRELKGTISLAVLSKVAAAMNCKLVYGFVPLEPLDEILESQARNVAKKQVGLINHSMKLEQQGLSPKQLKQQEDDLVEELLKGNLKNLWGIDDV